MVPCSEEEQPPKKLPPPVPQRAAEPQRCARKAVLSECFPPRLQLPLCLQEDQRRPNLGIRGWMHAEGRAQLCAVGAQCCRGRLPEQQIPAELDVLVWFFFSPAAQDPIAKHKAMVGNGTIAESWDRSTGPILGVISSMEHHPVTAVGFHSMQCKE